MFLGGQEENVSSKENSPAPPPPHDFINERSLTQAYGVTPPIRTAPPSPTIPECWNRLSTNRVTQKILSKSEATSKEDSLKKSYIPSLRTRKLTGVFLLCQKLRSQYWGYLCSSCASTSYSQLHWGM